MTAAGGWWQSPWAVIGVGLLLLAAITVLAVLRRDDQREETDIDEPDPDHEVLDAVTGPGELRTPRPAAVLAATVLDTEGWDLRGARDQEEP